MFRNLYWFPFSGNAFVGAVPFATRKEADDAARDVCEGSFPPMRRIGTIRPRMAL